MDARQAIAANVQLVIEQLGPASELDFGLNRPSVEWLEGFIERQRVQPHADKAFVDRMVDILGSFLGECVAANSGGAWHWDEERQTWGVRLAEDRYAFPFAKVQKAFDNGLDCGDSILGFYDIALDHRRTFPPGGSRN
jgi:hypothetical protein